MKTLKGVRVFNVILSFLVSAAALIACGVKGDPVPPATPAEIGHGKPLFKTDDESGSATQIKPGHRDEQKDGQDSDDDQ